LSAGVWLFNHPDLVPDDATNIEFVENQSRTPLRVAIDGRTDTRKGYNSSLTHVSLNKVAPRSRTAETVGRMNCRPVLAGLHHQYVRI
jgi:hypothetical protein